MKIETDMIKDLLEESKDSLLREVDDSSLIADYMDKMFNFGVMEMFHKVLIKLYEAENIAKKVSA